MALRFLLQISLLLAGLVFFDRNCLAKSVPGFIITENSDTVIGEVQIYYHNPNIRGFTFYGLDIEQFYTIVRFKGNTEKRFRNYEPADIKGFCFRYQSNDYIFREFKLEANSLFSIDQTQHRFLNLIYKGKISLYFDEVRKPMVKNFKNFIEYTEKHYNYYLFDEVKGILKVELTKNIKNVRDIIALYNVEEDFLKEIPVNAKPKEIVHILMQYDNWLMQH